MAIKKKSLKNHQIHAADEFSFIKIKINNNNKS
jgi:hypothetical protein